VKTTFIVSLLSASFFFHRFGCLFFAAQTTFPYTPHFHFSHCFIFFRFANYNDNLVDFVTTAICDCASERGTRKPAMDGNLSFCAPRAS